MIYNLSKLLSATLIIVMIMLAATTGKVFSAGTYNIISNTNSASLNASGTNTSVTSGITFGTVTINMAGAITPISKTDFIRIDNTVTPKIGWNVKVSATNFTATVTDYSSAVGGATLTVNIPANTILTVTPQAPTASGNVPLTGMSAQNTSGIAVASTGVKVLSASASGCGGAGCGYDSNNGYYLQQLNYTLTIPNYLPGTATITGAQADSKFIPANRTAGAKIGLFAGTYSSTITYAIAAGP
jgi:hypothetical protein